MKYNRHDSNEDYFHRRNAQLWWAVRHRALLTQRLLDGDPVNPRWCLFIDRACAANLGAYMEQMSQPEWEENSSGKIVITKQPRIREGSTSKMPSPDMADGTVLAFAYDSRRGLVSSKGAPRGRPVAA